MEIGDKVFIFDLNSDLYCMTGEVIDIDGDTAVVMVQTLKWRRARDCIVDRFRMDELCVKTA